MSQIEKAHIRESSFLTAPTLNRELLEMLGKAEASTRTYPVGLDSTSGVGWAFLPDVVYMFWVCQEQYRRQFIDYSSLSRMDEIALVRPVIVTYRDISFAIFTTGRDVVSVELFNPDVLPHKRRLENLRPNEFILQMSNPISIPNRSDAWVFASITNFGSIYIHEISINIHRNQPIAEVTSWKSISLKRDSLLSSTAKKLSNLLFSNSDDKPDRPELNKAKLELSEDLILTIVTDTYVEEQRITQNVHSYNARPVWQADIPDNLSILDAIVVDNQAHSRLVLGLWKNEAEGSIYLRAFRWYDNEDQLRIIEDILLEKLPGVDSEAFGRLFKLTSHEYFVVLSTGRGHNVVLKTEGSLVKFERQTLPSSIIGASVISDSTSAELAVFTQRGLFSAVVSKGTNNQKQSRIEEEPLTYNKTFLQRTKDHRDHMGDKEVEETFHKAFRDYYLGNTLGYMAPLGRFNVSSFNDFLRRLLLSMESSMNDFSKLVYVETRTRQATGSRTLLMSDIEQRIARCQKFLKFIQLNKLEEFLTSVGKTAFIKTYERLLAIAELRKCEEGPYREFIKEVPAVKTLQVYEDPRFIIDVLLYMLERSLVSMDREEQAAYVHTIVAILRVLNETRSSIPQEFKTDLPLEADWILERGHFLDGIVSLALRHQSGAAINEELVMIVALLLTNLKKSRHSDHEISKKLDTLYEGLLAGKNQKIAFKAASNAGDQERISWFLIQNNYNDKRVDFDQIIKENDDSFQTFLEDAVSKLGQADQSSEISNALKFLHSSDREEEVKAYLMEHQPNFYWLHIASKGDFRNAIPMTPDTNLLGSAFKSAMECLEYDRDSVADIFKIQNHYVTEVLMTPEESRGQLKPTILHILDHKDLSPRERAQYALMVALSDSLHPGESRFDCLKPIFRYLIRHDRDKSTSQLLHLALWSLVSKAVQSLEYRNYDDLIRASGFGNDLDEKDYNTVTKVMEVVGWDYERQMNPTSQRLFYGAL